MANFSTVKTATLLAVLAAFLTLSAPANADKPKSPIKKTLDGKCITPDHPDYWDTKIYIAKPSVESCIASGGELVASTN